MVLLQVFIEIIRSQHLCDLHQLIAVAIPHEKGLLLEDLYDGGGTIEANMAPVDQISSE